MKMKRSFTNLLKITLIPIILLGSFSLLAMSEEEKISFLLKKIEESQAIFIRNEVEHSALDAKNHLESKLARAKQLSKLPFRKKRVIDAKIFINEIASGSTTSGTPYKMRLPDGKIVTTKDWLTERLIELETKAVEAKPKPLP